MKWYDRVLIALGIIPLWIIALKLVETHELLSVCLVRITAVLWHAAGGQ